MARALADVWLATGGHGIYEHLGTAPVRAGRLIPEARGITSPRAEDLLCGCLAYYSACARESATRAGLQVADLTQSKARAMWDGRADPDYRAYVMAEYQWAGDAVDRQWCARKLAGSHDADLYESSPAHVAEALAGHIVRLAQVRALLLDAERLLQGATLPRRRQRTGVTV